MKKELYLLTLMFAVILNLNAQHVLPVKVFGPIPLLSGSLSIDGYDNEPDWSPTSAVSELFNSTGWSGTSDLSADVRLCYDKNNLYVFIKVNDDIAYNFGDGTSSYYWDYDNVEIFLDMDTTTTDAYGYYGNDALQIRYNRGVDGTVTGHSHRTGADYLNFVIIDNGDSWQVETAIPWTGIVPEGTLINDIWDSLNINALGFDLQIADNDGSGRDAQLAWDADYEGSGDEEDDAWENTNLLGIIELIAKPTIGDNYLNRDLIGYYPFNGNANDMSPFKKDGIVVGATLTSDRNGNLNSAYYFDGIDDYIMIDDSLLISNTFTISFWANSEKTTGNSTILCDGSESVSGNDFEIDFIGNDIGIRADKNAILNHKDDVISELQNLDLVKNWVHVVWVMDPTCSKIFVNGIQKAVINEAGSNIGYHDGYALIGARKVLSNMDYFFNGKIDDLLFYNNRCLTQSEIDALYNGNVYFETITVYDTIHVFDTVKVYKNISVTDTLIINVAISEVNSVIDNQLKVYPNPAKDKIFINTGTYYDKMIDYTVKIMSTSGAVIFESDITDQLFEININDFGKNGLYFIQIIDNNKQIIEIKKIVLE